MHIEFHTLLLRLEEITFEEKFVHHTHCCVYTCI